MIEIKKLKNYDKNRAVKYDDGVRDIETGVISSWNDNFIFVKFNKDGIASACPPKTLSFVNKKDEHYIEFLAPHMHYATVYGRKTVNGYVCVCNETIFIIDAEIPTATKSTKKIYDTKFKATIKLLNSIDLIEEVITEINENTLNLNNTPSIDLPIKLSKSFDDKDNTI